MDTDKHRWETRRISQLVIIAAHQSGITLGSGFLEKVYENVLAVEIRKTELLPGQQHPIEVKYGDGVWASSWLACWCR